MSLRVHGFSVGTIPTRVDGLLYAGGGISPRVNKKDLLPWGHFEDEKGLGVNLCSFIWYVEGAKQRILVDTGFDDPATVNKVMKKYSYEKGISDRMWSRTPEQEIVKVLQKINVTPEQIEIVVLTHLHYDHFANNELFTNATFIVQKDEIAPALAPPPYAMWYYREYASHILNVMDRVKTVEGDVYVDEGIQLWKLGGHSPGSQAVVVDTDKGRVALMGDVAGTYKNLELIWPSGVFWDLEQTIEAYHRALREADIVVPGHDYKFFELFPNGRVG